MTPFLAFAAINLALHVLGNLAIARLFWRRTDKSVPFVSFWEVANRPLAKTWGGQAWMWPGTADPKIARHWRAEADRAFRWLTLFFALHLGLASAAVAAGLMA